MKRTLQILVLVLVLASAACDLVKTTPTDPSPTPTPTPTTPSSAVSYTAVGASDAIGYGSSEVCLPFSPCPNGKGYVQLIGRRFQDDGKAVTLLNLGLPGGVLSPEIQSIGNALGRGIASNFIDNEMAFVATGSTLVTVFAGGNDVNVIGAALDAGYGGNDQAAYLLARRQGFGRDLRRLYAGIKSRAPSSRVVWLNLPNFAALPYAAGYTLEKKRALQDISAAFSAEINALRQDGALVVDVMCDSFFYQAGGYAADGFHPNDAGYQRMADVTYPPAVTGQTAAPQASCPQMRVF